jgi:hypothetical protein
VITAGTTLEAIRSSLNMADIIYIPPNFGIKKFQTAAELKAFLKRFCFQIIIRRSNRDVWETIREPKRRAISYKSKTGLYIAAQLSSRKRNSTRRRRLSKPASLSAHRRSERTRAVEDHPSPGSV